jgi:hypothetical protein
MSLELATPTIAGTPPDRFNISPIVRITLLSLYVTLTVPLPFLAAMTQAPVPPMALWIGIVLGAVFLYGVLSERVLVDDDGIRVVYPGWVPWRSGWAWIGPRLWR